MEKQSIKTSVLEKILLSNDLDEKQISFYKKYEKDQSFVKILQTKTYDEIPHTLDYFRLVEKEITAKKMPNFFEDVISKKEAALKEADKIKNCFSVENEWSHKLFPVNQKHLTTPDDIKTIKNLCNALAKTDFDAAEIFVSFFENLVKSKKEMQSNIIEGNKSVEDYLEKLSDDWYSEPWYYTYVQYFGTKSTGKGTFETFRKQLDYLEELGIKNIYILPHYQSPNGDAGYDISDYKPSKDFGGEKEFKEFIFEATKRGFRVATDLVFNHTATEHKWFLKALDGESKYFDYYLKCPKSWDNINQILKDEDGDLFLYLNEKDENGEPVISKRILIFPDVDKTLWLKKEVKKLDKDVLFYREFYPFQVDLDLQNPKVANELFEFLGKEVSMGILGKRTDAIAHWIKKPGTNAKDLPETYALQQLIKQFIKHLSSKTIVLPEVVTTSKHLKGYAGETTVINGKKTTTGGDALFDFQLQAMLREMMYFEKTTPFWTQIHDRGEEGVNTSVPLLPIEHHDETYMGFIQETEKMRDYIQGTYAKVKNKYETHIIKRGIIYKNGMSGGARYANCLNEDKKRIAAAFFCQYMMPATPVIYFGTEIGATNRLDQLELRQKEQFNTLKKLLGDKVVGEGKSITMQKCEDPRELQRGAITAKTYNEALKNKYPAVEVIKTLNKMRADKSALRSYNFSHIDTFSESIFGMVKFPDKQSEQPLIALANLSGKELTAKIPYVQLIEKIRKVNFTLNKVFEMNTNESSSNILEIKPTEFIYIQLKPYQCLLYSLRK